MIFFSESHANPAPATNTEEAPIRGPFVVLATGIGLTYETSRFTRRHNDAVHRDLCQGPGAQRLKTYSDNEFDIVGWEVFGGARVKSLYPKNVEVV